MKSAKKRLGEHHSIHNTPQSIEEWLELSKELDSKVSQPGKKRVSYKNF